MYAQQIKIHQSRMGCAYSLAHCTIRALLIGVSDYWYLNVATPAESGARRMHETITHLNASRLSDISLLVNDEATPGKILQIAHRLASATKENDLTFIYLAGI